MTVSLLYYDCLECIASQTATGKREEAEREEEGGRSKDGEH